jgi:hypothetical protein
MKRHFFVYTLLLLLLTSCEFKCNIGKTEDVNTSDTKSNSGSTQNSGNNSGSGANYDNGVNTSQIMNNIEIKATGGVKVYRAFLRDDQGNLIKDNTVGIGENVVLVINVEEGWQEEGGRSWIGASEVVSSDNGTEIMNTGDMLARYDDSGLSADDAKFVALKAVVTDISGGVVDHFVVNFRVWDKKGSGEITGSYKFRLRQ